MSDYVIGIDLGGTHMQIGVVDGGHSIVGRSRAKTLSYEGVDAVVARMAAGVDEACKAAGIARDDLTGVGLAAPSPIDSDKTTIINAVNLEWRNVPLGRLLSEALGGVPVTLDNDVNAAAWGEFRAGAAMGFHSVLAIWVGTGIGGGLVLDDQLYHGPFGTAGEFGRMAAYTRFSDGAVAAIEDHASRTSVVARVRERSGADDVTIATIAEAFKRGDEVVTEVVHDAAEVVGIAAANAATLLSLDAIVLGGGMAEALGSAYVALVREAFDRAVFPETLQECAIVLTTLRDNAGLLGAALLARERFQKG